MKPYKSNKAISQKALTASNKLRDIYEDAYINNDAKHLVDFVKIMQCIEHLENVSKMLINKS